jgi:hypothetical protein
VFDKNNHEEISHKSRCSGSIYLTRNNWVYTDMQMAVSWISWQQFGKKILGSING